MSCGSQVPNIIFRSLQKALYSIFPVIDVIPSHASPLYHDRAMSSKICELEVCPKNKWNIYLTVVICWADQHYYVVISDLGPQAQWDLPRIPFLQICCAIPSSSSQFLVSVCSICFSCGHLVNTSFCFFFKAARWTLWIRERVL